MCKAASRREVDGRAILQMIEEISGELELRPLLTKIVRHACDLLNADRGSIGLVDKARNLVRTEAVFQMPGGELGLEMQPGEGIAGAVLVTQKPLILQRYGNVERPVYSDMAEDAVVGVPIVWRGEMIGFFGLGADPPRMFSEADIDALSLFARHAAIAIHNARLFEKEKRRTARVTAVSRIAQLITSSLSLEEILQTAVEALNTSLAFSSTGIFLTSSDDPESLVLQARLGPGDRVKVGQYRQTFGEGNVGLAAAQREAIYVADTRRDANYLSFPGAEVLNSELALPIIVGEDLLGVLNVESETRISPDDITGLKIVADQLGVAIAKARLFAETEATLDKMQLLYETSQRINMAMDVEGVVEAYLSQVAARSHYRATVAYFRHDAAGDREAIIRLGSWLPGEGVTLERYEVRYFKDAFDELLDAGQTVTMRDVASDPRASATLKEAQLKGGYPSLALIPLISRGQRIGVIALSVARPHLWSDDDLRPYQVTAAQLAAALVSREQQQRLVKGEQRLAALDERQRLARELHDSVTQVIFGMTLVAQTIGPAMTRDPAEGARRVARLLELAQKARAEMRALLAELRPSEDVSLSLLPDALRVREYGLVRALETLLSENGDGRVVLSAAGYERRAVSVEQALYRVVQEALTNARKHANAREVCVTLASHDGATQLTVEDDGCGFEIGSVQEKAGEHLGLNSMRERSKALGAQFELTSVPGVGTRIRLQVPA